MAGFCPAVFLAGTTQQEIVFCIVPNLGTPDLWKINIAAGDITQLASDGGFWIKNADGTPKTETHVAFEMVPRLKIRVEILPRPLFPQRSRA